MLNRTQLTQEYSPPSLLQSILDSSLSGIIVLKSVYNKEGEIDDFRFTLANSVAEKHINLTDYSGRTVKEVFGTGWTSLPDHFKHVVRTREPLQLEHSRQLPNRAHPDWFRVSISPLDDGVTVCYDSITDLKLTSARLEEQIREYNQVLNSSANGIVNYRVLRNEAGCATDLQAIYVNDTGVRVSGISRLVFLSLPYSQIVRGGERDALLPWLLEAIQSRKERSRILEDRNRYYEVTAVPHPNETITLTYSDITDVRRLQLQQQQDAQRLRAVLDTTQTGLFIITPFRDGDGQLVDFLFTDANHTVAALLGLEAGDLREKLCSSLFGNYQQNGLFSLLVDLYEREASERFEFYYEGDGIDSWFDASAKRLGDEMLVNFIDITESKNLLLKEQQTTNLLQTVVDNIHSGIALLEPVYGDTGELTDLKFVLVNDINASVSGFTKERFLESTQLNLFPESMQSGLYGWMAEVAETGQPIRRLLPYDSDDIKGWFDISLTPVEGKVLFSFLDVTETKRAEIDHGKTASLLQTVIDNSPSGLMLLEAVRDHGGQIVDFRYILSNPASVSITGLPAEAVHNHRFVSNQPGYDQSELFDKLKVVTQTGESQNLLLELNSGTGSNWFDFTLTRQGDGVLSLFRDVTDVYHYRHALETKNRDLERSNANLRQFAYVASHDLQEPLRKIQAFGDILHAQYAPALGETGEDLISRMQGAARRMASLIQGLLMFSRISNQGLRLDTVDLNRLANNIVIDLEVLLEESGGRVEISDLPAIQGDYTQLQQLFQNLIGNALKFRRQDVTPLVVIKNQQVIGAQLPADWGLKPAQLYYRIEVQDNGIGFEEKYLVQIFELFQRLHGKLSYGGTGIGLSICKRVVENHHGYITATSQLNQGSTFIIVLPV